MQYGVLRSTAPAASPRAARLFALPTDAVSTRCYTTAATAPSQVLALAHGDVHVHWFHSEKVNDGHIGEYTRLLSPAEQQRVRESGDAVVQQQRILARAFVRSTLSRYLPRTEPQQLSFGAGPHGKPHLIPQSAAASAQVIAGHLQFNLSHTASLIGCAVTLGCPVGLDVELASRAIFHKDVIKIARRKFSPQEVAQLEGTCDPLARQQLFMALWTLKESVVKAKGTGINAPPGLRGFSVGLHAPPSCSIEEILAANSRGQLQTAAVEPSHQLKLQLAHSVAGDNSTYSLMLCKPTPAHYAALCVQQHPAAAFADGSQQGFHGANSTPVGAPGVNQVPGVHLLGASDGWSTFDIDSSLHAVAARGTSQPGLRLQMFESSPDP